MESDLRLFRTVGFPRGFGSLFILQEGGKKMNNEQLMQLISLITSCVEYGILTGEEARPFIIQILSGLGIK